MKPYWLIDFESNVVFVIDGKNIEFFLIITVFSLYHMSHVFVVIGGFLH